MGIQIVKNRNIPSYGITEYVCDTENDIKDLPNNITAGSRCLCIENSKVYMLNTSKKWIAIITGDQNADISALATELSNLEKAVLYKPDNI